MGLVKVEKSELINMRDILNIVKELIHSVDSEAIIEALKHPPETIAEAMEHAESKPITRALGLLYSMGKTLDALLR